MCILELSKATMYWFYYDYTKNKYGNKSRLLFEDNDRLVYEIEPENVYNNFSENKEMIDSMNYSAKSKNYDDSNALSVGTVKGEMGGVAIEEFLG